MPSSRHVHPFTFSNGKSENTVRACRELQIHASAELSEGVMVRNQCQREGSVRMSQILFKKQPWPYVAFTRLHNVY